MRPHLATCKPEFLVFGRPDGTTWTSADDVVWRLDSRYSARYVASDVSADTSANALFKRASKILNFSVYWCLLALSLTTPRFHSSVLKGHDSFLTSRLNGHLRRDRTFTNGLVV